jgi:hypothetical protein
MGVRTVGATKVIVYSCRFCPQKVGRKCRLTDKVIKNTEGIPDDCPLKEKER